jgi:hypothetical protein
LTRSIAQPGIAIPGMGLVGVALLGMALLAALCLAGAVPARAEGAPDCSVPRTLLPAEATFPALARQIKAGGPVTIVAIGGASTLGEAAGAPEKSYPGRLEALLQARYPGLAIRVVNRGQPRQTARQMIDRFERDVFGVGPALVIWETGTNEAVRGIDVEEFKATLQAGTETLRNRGIDVMLMDMQFARGSAAVLPFEEYLNALRRVADVSEVPLFRRYDMMRYWAETGVFDYDALARRDRPRELVSAVYECLSLRLVEVISRGLS